MARQQALVAQLRGDLDRARAGTVDDTGPDVARLREELEQAQTKEQQTRNELEQQKETAQEELERQQAAVNALEDELARVRAGTGHAGARVAALQQQIKQVREQEQAARAEVARIKAQAERDLAAANAEYAELAKRMRDNFDATAAEKLATTALLEEAAARVASSAKRVADADTQAAARVASAKRKLTEERTRKARQEKDAHNRVEIAKFDLANAQRALQDEQWKHQQTQEALNDNANNLTQTQQQLAQQQQRQAYTDQQMQEALEREAAATANLQASIQELKEAKTTIALMSRRAGGGAAQACPETTQPEPAIATNSEPPRTDATNPSGARGYDVIDTFSSGAADGAHSDTVTGTDAASHVSDAESVNEPEVAGPSAPPAAGATNAPPPVAAPAAPPAPPPIVAPAAPPAPPPVVAPAAPPVVRTALVILPAAPPAPAPVPPPVVPTAPNGPAPTNQVGVLPDGTETVTYAEPDISSPNARPRKRQVVAVDERLEVVDQSERAQAESVPFHLEPASEPAAPESIGPQATAPQTAASLAPQPLPVAPQTTAPPARQPQPEPQPPAAPQAPQPATQPPAQSAAFHPGSAHSDTATGTDPGGGTSTDAENAVEASAVSAPAIGMESDIYSDIELALSTDPSVSGLGSVQSLTDSVDLALREVAGIDQPDAIARALRAVAADLEQDNTQGIFEPGNPDDVDPDQMDDIPVASAVHGDANEYLPEAEEEGASENEYIPDAEKEDAPENEDLPDAEEEVSENEDLPDASERQEDVQKKRSKRLLEKRRKNNRVAKAVAAYEAVAMTGPRIRATVQPINITKAGGVNKGQRHARQALIERVLRAFPAEDQRPSAFDGPF